MAGRRRRLPLQRALRAPSPLPAREEKKQRQRLNPRVMVDLIYDLYLVAVTHVTPFINLLLRGVVYYLCGVFCWCGCFIGLVRNIELEC